jgi:haloacetate dehalogenase
MNAANAPDAPQAQPLQPPAVDDARWPGFSPFALPGEGGLVIRGRVGGTPGRPPLVLLHGFPETHAMWRRVALVLAPHFRLVLPDLRGYGASDRPAHDAPGHAQMGKRAMAADVVAVMRALGHERFMLAGHDRGARAAHRLALDHPGVLERLALIDIAPTLDMYGATDRRFATAYYHWFFLIQPAPLPERLINADPTPWLHAKLGGWGAAGLAHVEPEALAAYEQMLRDPAAVHALCEDYRASGASGASGATPGVDLQHDEASRARGERIACDTLVMWGTHGVVHRLFDPVTLWRAQCAAGVEAAPLPTGHFVPEEAPEAVAGRLRAFFGG